MACRRKKIIETSISAFLVDVNLTIFGHATLTTVHKVLNKTSTMINTALVAYSNPTSNWSI
jgi:hypothetical protein